jgi:hypothetical protein
MLTAKGRYAHLSPTGVKAFKKPQKCALHGQGRYSAKTGCHQPVAYSALRVQAFPGLPTDAALGLSRRILDENTRRCQEENGTII